MKLHLCERSKSVLCNMFTILFSCLRSSYELLSPRLSYFNDHKKLILTTITYKNTIQLSTIILSSVSIPLMILNFNNFGVKLLYLCYHCLIMNESINYYLLLNLMNS